MAECKNYMSMDTVYTYCDHGTDKQRVYMSESHGVINQKDKKPVLNANDYKYPENIKGYGYCKATKAHSVLRRHRHKHGKYATPTTICRPILEQAWQDCDPHYTIEGAPVVLDTSCLVCSRGGIIRFVKEGSEESKMQDASKDEYSAFRGINNALDKFDKAVAEHLPKCMKDLKDVHLTLGNRENGLYADLYINAVDADYSVTEFKPKERDLTHENAIQSKTGAEVGFTHGDLNISAGGEVEAGKTKSGDISNPENPDAKVFVKGKVKDAEAEASIHADRKKEVNAQYGNFKITGEKDKDGKYSGAVSVSDKHD